MSYYTSGNLAHKPEIKANNKVTRSSKPNQDFIHVKEKVFYLFSVAFVVIMASIVISNYAQIVEYNYSIQKVEKSITQIVEENDSLQLKIAELSSPERILDIAQNKLGMTVEEERIVVLSQKERTTNNSARN